MNILTTLLMMGEGAKPDLTMNIMFIVLLIVICYFVIIRPQLIRNKLSNINWSSTYSINEQKIINTGGLLKGVFYSIIWSIGISLLLGIICYFNSEYSSESIVILFCIGVFNSVYILTCLYSIAFNLESFTNEIKRNSKPIPDKIKNTSSVKSTGMKGIITDASTDVTIRNAKIEILGSLKSITSNNDGIYELTNIPSGIFDIRVTAFGYQTEILKSIELINGNINVVNIQIKPNP